MKLQPNTTTINRNTLLMVDTHTINQEEERSGFISNSSSNQSLSSPGWSIQEDSTRWLRGEKDYSYITTSCKIYTCLKKKKILETGVFILVVIPTFDQEQTCFKLFNIIVLF